MKYKVGDKVKIRSKEELAKAQIPLMTGREKYLNKYHPDRVLEIYSTVDEYCYRIKNCSYNWMDDMIEGYACLCISYLYISYNERIGEHVEGCPLYSSPDKIKNRWEILDLRG